ncbi:uncharacterized protein LOC126332394 [Schistocerca gregaria]|uniref:uncharacterized protein LOC126332394 n=1 Tax=Schistocerca gregaria TaxID=7010 RepID=UPI00211E36AB|nr:uncharacterized protein LOC126332394 [Schistocerca gregaria]
MGSSFLDGDVIGSYRDRFEFFVARDLFSTACLAFELLTGSRLFHRGNAKYFMTEDMSTGKGDPRWWDGSCVLKGGEIDVKSLVFMLVYPMNRYYMRVRMDRMGRRGGISDDDASQMKEIDQGSPWEVEPTSVLTRILHENCSQCTNSGWDVPLRNRVAFPSYFDSVYNFLCGYYARPSAEARFRYLVDNWWYLSGLPLSAFMVALPSFLEHFSAEETRFLSVDLIALLYQKLGRLASIQQLLKPVAQLYEGASRGELELRLTLKLLEIETLKTMIKCFGHECFLEEILSYVMKCIYFRDDDPLDGKSDEISGVQDLFAKERTIKSNSVASKAKQAIIKLISVLSPLTYIEHILCSLLHSLDKSVRPGLIDLVIEVSARLDNSAVLKRAFPILLGMARKHFDWFQRASHSSSLPTDSCIAKLSQIVTALTKLSSVVQPSSLISYFQSHSQILRTIQSLTCHLGSQSCLKGEINHVALPWSYFVNVIAFQSQMAESSPPGEGRAKPSKNFKKTHSIIQGILAELSTLPGFGAPPDDGRESGIKHNKANPDEKIRSPRKLRRFHNESCYGRRETASFSTHEPSSDAADQCGVGTTHKPYRVRSLSRNSASTKDDSEATDHSNSRLYTNSHVSSSASGGVFATSGDQACFEGRELSSVGADREVNALGGAREKGKKGWRRAFEWSGVLKRGAGKGGNPERESRYVGGTEWAETLEVKGREAWELELKRLEEYEYHEHNAEVRCLSTDEGGKYVVSGAEDRLVKVWNLQKRECSQQTYYGHRDVIIGVSLSKDATMAVSCDGEIHRWSVERGQCLNKIKSGKREYKILSDLGEDLLVTTTGKKIDIIDFRAPDVQCEWNLIYDLSKTSSDRITSIGYKVGRNFQPFYPTTQLLIGQSSGYACSMDLRFGSLTQHWLAHLGSVKNISSYESSSSPPLLFSYDSHNNALSVWDDYHPSSTPQLLYQFFSPYSSFSTFTCYRHSLIVSLGHSLSLVPFHSFLPHSNSIRRPSRLSLLPYLKKIDGVHSPITSVLSLPLQSLLLLGNTRGELLLLN